MREAVNDAANHRTYGARRSTAAQSGHSQETADCTGRESEPRRAAVVMIPRVSLGMHSLLLKHRLRVSWPRARAHDYRRGTAANEIELPKVK
jgi:hypothetical protein